jgi:glutathione peroxidase
MSDQRSIYTFDVCDVHGNIIRLKDYRNHIILIVNTASECGFAIQMQELEALYQNYRAFGFIVLAFPSDEFNQEPMDNEEIRCSISENQHCHYPIFQKVDLNGDQAHPLFQYLTHHLPGIFGSRSIKWNFTKFLIDQHGHPIRRYSPITHLNVVESDIRELITQSDQPPQ